MYMYIHVFLSVMTAFIITNSAGVSFNKVATIKMLAMYVLDCTMYATESFALLP